MTVFQNTVDTARFDILADIQARYKAAVDREIRADLDRVVTHLSRTHHVPQDHILKIMQVYSQEKLEK